MNRTSVIPGLAAVGCLWASCLVRAQDGCEPEWSSVGGGAEWFAEVRAFAPFDQGHVELRPLFVGGAFEYFDGLEVNEVARWDGWKAATVGGGLTEMSVGLNSLTALNGPVGGVAAGLYACGGFLRAGDLPVNNLARWDGGIWQDVGGGLMFDPPEILVIGRSSRLFDEDGPGPLATDFFVGGRFTLAGGVSVNGIARWDGQTWTDVGGGLSTGNPNSWPTVYSLGVFDDGRGPALYVGGSFYYAGGKKAYNIARWDGNSWEPVGGPAGGLDSVVHSLTVYDEDGPGPNRPALFAGGSFSHAVGIPDPIWHIARWDGQNWSPVGGWISDGSVFASAVWKGPDDERENLYIGGTFNLLPDHSPIKGIARWDGKTWREVDYGVDGFGEGTQVDAIHPFDEDGDGPNPGGLYVGGMFHYAGTKGVQSYHIARWGCPLPPRCDADLDRSGALDLFDFLAFLNLFNAEDPTADCTADGDFDLFDFLCFVNAFNAGCP